MYVCEFVFWLDAMSMATMYNLYQVVVDKEGLGIWGYTKKYKKNCAQRKFFFPLLEDEKLSLLYIIQYVFFLLSQTHMYFIYFITDTYNHRSG